MTEDFDVMKTMIKKGISSKIPKEESTEEQADEILKPIGGYTKEDTKE
ncbi:MAG: hypothetical protein PHG06_00550 [Parabacteroides sp.]|nr:hypothetical protein [Parabacteroides sp.]